MKYAFLKNYCVCCGVFMKKSYRIKKESDFQNVFENRNSFANRKFIIYVISNKKNKHFRVGISVGKKVGNAVMRNIIKRYIRQSILEFKPYLRFDVDFLVIARPQSSGLKMDEIKKNLEHVLSLSSLFL